LMGLNNIAMGHSAGNRTGIKNHAAFNKDVLFQLLPDIINIPCTEKYSDDYLNGIGGDRQFLDLYQCVSLKDPQSKIRIDVFIRKVWLDQWGSQQKIIVTPVSTYQQAGK
jgi:hypothetical protein